VEGGAVVTEALFVSRTMAAMELLAFEPLTAAELASALQVHPRTARRLLARLVADGWVERLDGSRRIYAPTLRLVALAAQLADRTPLAHAAAPIVAELSAQTGGVAHLAIPSYTSALCLVQGDGARDARPRLRELIPAHATASGKVLLAYRDPWRESVLATELARSTARTIVDPTAIRRESAAIRERGYATEDGEYVDGLAGIAAPVRVAGDAVPAALGLSIERGGHDLPALSALLREAALRVSRSLAAVA
jgi:DNA-binding IclR family transcriptional regulator